MTTGPCAPWINESEIAGACNEKTKREDAVAIATAILFRWSGRQYPGICTRTVRPCVSQGGCGSWPASFPLVWDYPVYDTILNPFPGATPTVPYLSGGEWRNRSLCGGRCNLPVITSVPGPIREITQIVVDGQPLDPSTYRIQGRFRIVRVDGGTWPCFQDYALDSAPGGDPGTWQVTYKFGRAPGADGLAVCRLFATEIALFLCSRGTNCELPADVQRLVGEGVDIILDPSQSAERSSTGIKYVDDWLRSVNPGRLARRTTFSRLDKPMNYGGMR